jgi:hypothetical protein
MPIILFPLTNLPDAWASCVALAMLTVSHSHRYSEIWRQDSISLRTESCFSCTLRKRRCRVLGLRLSPKSNNDTALSLWKKSSVLLREY